MDDDHKSGSDSDLEMVPIAVAKKAAPQVLLSSDEEDKNDSIVPILESDEDSPITKKASTPAKRKLGPKPAPSSKRRTVSSGSDTPVKKVSNNAVSFYKGFLY